MPHYVDSNLNRISVERTRYTLPTGEPLVVVRLIADPSHGYIAADEGRGGFGNDDCPSSYGMPCLTWFGTVEAYPTAADALAAILA